MAQEPKTQGEYLSIWLEEMGKDDPVAGSVKIPIFFSLFPHCFALRVTPVAAALVAIIPRRTTNFYPVGWRKGPWGATGNEGNNEEERNRERYPLILCMN